MTVEHRRNPLALEIFNKNVVLLLVLRLAILRYFSAQVFLNPAQGARLFSLPYLTGTKGVCHYRHTELQLLARWLAMFLLQVPSVERANRRNIVFGTLLSIDQFIAKLQGEKVERVASFRVYQSNNYKVQTLETATGISVLLFSDPTFPDAKSRLRRCCHIFHKYRNNKFTQENGPRPCIHSCVLEQELVRVLRLN